MTIAGSDPSGGAGIQADLKTFSALGAYGCEPALRDPASSAVMPSVHADAGPQPV